MAKRFTSTEKWSDPWYRKLSPKHKCLWDWLFTQCDIAGTINPDYELASFQIGIKIDEDDLKYFSRQIKKLSCGRLFLIKFIEFQYGELTFECRAHRPVLKLIDRLSIPYHDIINRDKEQEQEQEQDQDKDKDQEQEKEKGVQGEISLFDQFWKAYPKKVGKAAAEKSWEKIKAPTETLKIILINLEWQIKSEQWIKEAGQYIPMPVTYLNQARWLDEKAEVKNENNHPYRRVD